MFKKILLVLTLLTLLSCNVTKPVIVTKKPVPSSSKKVATRSVKKTNEVKSILRNDKKQVDEVGEVIEATSITYVGTDVIGRYISQYKDIAISNMRIYGIPASIILAQGILESGAGRGDLCIRANNHFGIKCHEGWTGESVRHDDDSSQECFRKYYEPAESFNDHALFLTGRSRYSSLFTLRKEDYKGWANGLRRAGYATDPKYPDKLISYIERYHLDQFDAFVMGQEYVPSENRDTRIAALGSQNQSLHEVQKGDTLYSISKKYNLLVTELKQINNLSANTISIGQRLIVK
ncbi:glucosaminidase domain-containing protein [Flavobacterium sp. ACAM 123]|uniref:glucosaminidase domain-containing protein n=1 Tax=Flavobacterium sp. ACAM 123 TaxID=1189620 RepID=UPI0002E5ACCE|nr:glucosaminidase domain-containing protein [Flavobacterium sp. ACAM 123]